MSKLTDRVGVKAHIMTEKCASFLYHFSKVIVNKGGCVEGKAGEIALMVSEGYYNDNGTVLASSSAGQFLNTLSLTEHIVYRQFGEMKGYSLGKSNIFYSQLSDVYEKYDSKEMNYEGEFTEKFRKNANGNYTCWNSEGDTVTIFPNSWGKGWKWVKYGVFSEDSFVKPVNAFVDLKENGGFKEFERGNPFVNWDSVPCKNKVKDSNSNKDEEDYSLPSPKETVEEFNNRWDDEAFCYADEMSDENFKKMEANNKRRKAAEEERKLINKDVRELLVNRFDELFDESVEYNEEYDKKYYRYTFKYCSSWSDAEHLVIASDIRDALFFYGRENIERNKKFEEEYALQNRAYYEDIGVKVSNSYEISELNEFIEWVYENYGVADTNDDFDIKIVPYLKELLKDIRGREISDEDVEFVNNVGNEFAHEEPVGKGPCSWSFLRRGQDNGEEYSTKEEAFDAYLCDTNYGFDDLEGHKLISNIPQWLKKVLEEVKCDDI